MLPSYHAAIYINIYIYIYIYIYISDKILVVVVCQALFLRVVQLVLQDCVLGEVAPLQGVHVVKHSQPVPVPRSVGLELPLRVLRVDVLLVPRLGGVQGHLGEDAGRRAGEEGP